MMETALRYELEQHIPELVGKIYPTNAPATATKPYLVYTRINTRGNKTYQGYVDGKALSYMFSIMAVKYPDMKSLTDKVEALLKSMILTSIGATGSIYTQSITINNISETYESELGVNRGIIDFTVYY